MQHPDTNLYRITCEPLAPGLPTISGTLEFAGMHLTSEGHELRFRGSTPLTEEPSGPAPWHRTWNHWEDVPRGVIVTGAGYGPGILYRKTPEGAPQQRGRFLREWAACPNPDAHAPFTRVLGADQ